MLCPIRASYVEHPVARQLIVFLSHISQINLVRVIGGADHAEEEALRQGEHAQEDKVVRRLTSSSTYIHLTAGELTIFYLYEPSYVWVITYTYSFNHTITSKSVNILHFAHSSRYMKEPPPP